jgi:hypothetical protein
MDLMDFGKYPGVPGKDGELQGVNIAEPDNSNPAEATSG